MVDLAERIATAPGFFKFADPRQRYSGKDLAETASRIVSGAAGMHGVPYSKSENFWHLDPMNDWHLTAIYKNGEWHCLIQFRGTTLGGEDVNLINAYALVICHQLKHYC